MTKRLSGIVLLLHDYPDLEVDCDRYNYKAVTIDVPPELHGEDGILLLNPNTGADPYDDAFEL